MVEITVDGDNVVFEIEGWDKLWSLRSRLQIPLAHIMGAHVDPEPAMGWFSGIKVAGAGIPNVFKAGIFYQEGQIVFWDVHHPEQTIVVDLEHEHFGKLVLEVADPQAAVKLVREAISVRHL